MSVTGIDINEEDMRVNGELLQDALEWALFLDRMQQQQSEASEQRQQPRRWPEQRYGQQRQRKTQHQRRRTIRSMCEEGCRVLLHEFINLGLAFFIGMIPGLGTLACFLLSYFKVYRPLSMLRIRETNHKALCQTMRRCIALDFAVGILFPAGPFIRLYFCCNLRMTREAQHWAVDHADRYTRAINQANSSSNAFSSSYSSSIYSLVPPSSYSYYSPYSCTSYPTTSELPFAGVGIPIGATSMVNRQQRCQISRAPSAISAPARLEQQHRLKELAFQKESIRQKREMRPVEEWIRRQATAAECRRNGADFTTSNSAVETKSDDNIKLDVVEVCEGAEEERNDMNASVMVATTTVSTSATTTAAATGTMDSVIMKGLGSLPPLGLHPRRTKDLNAHYKKPSAPSALTSGCEYGGVGGRGNNQSLYSSSAAGNADSGSAVEKVQDPRRYLLRTYHSDQDLVSLPNARLDGRQHQYPSQYQSQNQFQPQYNLQSRPVTISPHFRNKDILYTGPVLAHSALPLNPLGIHHPYHPLQNNESLVHEIEGAQSQLSTHPQQHPQLKTQRQSQDEQQQQQHVEEQGGERPRQKSKRRSAREPRSGGVARPRCIEFIYSTPSTIGSNSSKDVSAGTVVAGDGVGIVDSSGNGMQEQGDVGAANVHKKASTARGTPSQLMCEGSPVQAPQRFRPTATPNQEMLPPILGVSQAHEDHHRHLLPEGQQQERSGPVGLGIAMDGGRTATESQRRCHVRAKGATARDSSYIDI